MVAARKKIANRKRPASKTSSVPLAECANTTLRVAPTAPINLKYQQSTSQVLRDGAVIGRIEEDAEGFTYAEYKFDPWRHQELTLTALLLEVRAHEERKAKQ